MKIRLLVGMIFLNVIVANADEMVSINTNSEDVQAIAISPDGSKVATGGNKKRILIWNARTGGELLEYTQHKDNINDVQYSLNGKMIGSASDDGELRLWDSESGEDIFTYKNSYDKSKDTMVEVAGHAIVSIHKPFGLNSVNSLSFSDDGRFLTFGSADGSVKVVNIAEKKVTLIGYHRDEITKILFGKDSNTIYTSSEDGTIKEWDIEKKKALYTFRDYKEAVIEIALSPNKNYLAAISEDEQIIMYDLINKSIVNRDKEEDVETVAFIGNDRFALGIEDEIEVWDRVTFREKKTFDEHNDDILKIAYSHEGKVLVSLSDDKTVKIRKIELK